MNSRWMRNGFIYLLIVVAVIAILFTLFSDVSASREVSIDEVISMAKLGQIETIEVHGDGLTVITTRQETLTSRKEPGSSVIEMLQNSGVDPVASNMNIIVKGSSGLGSLFGILLNFLPLVFFGAVLLFMMRQAQGNSNQTFSFGRSRARMLVGNQPSVSFADVAGADEAKEELEEVVEFLKYPDRFLTLGARIPRGVLLVGSPGTGKTLLARAVSGEAGVPFFSISGSEFVEMFVGVGASRVRDLFDQAKRNAPCIVFIDEIDAVGRHRGAGLGGGHDEREQTLNQILVEMDGFDTSNNVIVLASTNRPDILDPALLRPGRFDRRVTLDLPDVKGRAAILEVHSKGKPLAEDVNLQSISKLTTGFSGADLNNLVNEAAILAARRSKTEIGASEFVESVDRVMLGPIRRSRITTEHEQEITAYHEAGHAIVGHLLAHADPIAKVTILSRGATGGHTRSLPEEDRRYWTLNQFKDMMAMAMGGRVAELSQFGEGEITTGASNDLENATNMARTMVTHYGMSEKLGPRTFGKREEMVFLGREISEQRNYSDKVAETIDDEVYSLVGEAYKRASEILSNNKAEFGELAKYLLKHETADGDLIKSLFNPPLAPDDGPTPTVDPEPSPAV
jgi:cell division protease FtsH